MKIGIHQPHYFPWAGWFNKMYSVDKFVILDQVQLEKGSFMYRNRIINDKGQIKYLTISADKHGFLEKKYSEIQTLNDEVFLGKQRDEIIRAYGNTQFYEDVWNELKELFETEENTICDYCVRSIMKIKEMLDIETEIIMQSSIDIAPSYKKNDLIIGLCKSIGGDEYLSGNGARKYNDEEQYKKEGIKLMYQQYVMPEYKQIGSDDFVPGLSILDTLFNCGIQRTREIITGD